MKEAVTGKIKMGRYEPHNIDLLYKIPSEQDLIQQIFWYSFLTCTDITALLFFLNTWMQYAMQQQYVAFFLRSPLFIPRAIMHAYSYSWILHFSFLVLLHSIFSLSVLVPQLPSSHKIKKLFYETHHSIATESRSTFRKSRHFY